MHERLGQLIDKEVKDNSWRPISIIKDGPSLSHIFFVDDLFLSVKMDVNQARTMRKVLNVFRAPLGHKVNASKIEVFFLKNIRPLEKDRIFSLLGFTGANDLGYYLGMPLLHKRITTCTFKFIVDKIKRKLDN